MLRNTIKYIGLLGALFFCGQVSAQHNQSSYSVIGIGEVNWGGYTQNGAMGGIGISHNSRFFLNNINPALMSSNFESVFQLGFGLDSRTVTGNTSTGNQSYGTTAGGFKDFGFVLPIKYAKWNMGFGLSPYTTVNYGFTLTGSGPEGSSTTTEVSGRGGIEEVFWTNSLRFNRLQLGLKFSYLFGAISTENLFSLDGLTQTAFGNSLVSDRNNYSGANATLGAAYQHQLSETRFLNFGAFYTPETQLNSTRLSTLQNLSAGGVIFSADTLIDNVRNKITLPARMGFGISYEKFQAILIGLDFQTQDWTQYITESGDTDPAYGQSFRLAIGGEYLPNYQDLKLLRRISYRFGVHYERTPYVINGQDVNDIGINLGASVPLAAFWGVSYVNLGVTFGRRGDITDDRVRENYFRINLGFSIQDVTWFSRGKFD